jgi:DNA-binding transcriptional ArsR family regulator
MPTDQEIHSALLAIYSRLDVIEGKVTVIARTDRDKLLDELKEIVKADPIIGRIYLALDGKKNQDQIVKDLDSSKPTVSRKLVKMSREHGIVEVAKEQSNSKIYRHNKEMEEVLHLSAKIEKWLGEIEKAKVKKAKAKP